MGTLSDYQDSVRGGQYGANTGRVVRHDMEKPKPVSWYKKINWYLVLALIFFVLSLYTFYKGGIVEVINSQQVEFNPPKVVKVSPSIKRRQRRAVAQVKQQLNKERVYNKVIDKYFEALKKKDLILYMQL